MSPRIDGRLSQTERTLRMLQHVGGAGLTQADVIGSPLDGGPPIMRLAVCVQRLRDAGYRVDSSRRRRRMAVYVLLEGVEHERSDVACMGRDAA